MQVGCSCASIKFLFSHLHLTPKENVLERSLTYTSPWTNSNLDNWLPFPRHRLAISKSLLGISELSSLHRLRRGHRKFLPVATGKSNSLFFFPLGKAFLLIPELFPSFRIVFKFSIHWANINWFHYSASHYLPSCSKNCYHVIILFWKRRKRWF